MSHIWRYPSEVVEYLEAHSSEYSIEDMAEKVNSVFGTEFTTAKMRSYYKNHKLHALPRKGRKRPEFRITTPEMDAFIRAHLAGTGYQEMATLLNKEFGTDFTKEQIKGYYARNKLNSGLTGRFEKGHIPVNKGRIWDEFMSPEGQQNSRKTQFKKGHIPHNGGAPVGTIRLRHDHTNRPGSKPYYWEKIAQPNTWRLKHQLVWEEHNGPIPDGCIITFANGDTLDYRLENLVLTTKAQNAVRNRLGLKSVDKESAEAFNEIANLRISIGKAKRKAKKDVRKKQRDKEGNNS